jgi:uncharacterized membrane protein
MSAPIPLSIIAKSAKYIWSLFLSGLITLLPITITFVIFNLTFTVVARWLEPIQQLRPAFLKAIPYSEFIIVILAVFLVGLLLKTLVFKPVLHSIERLITRIPLINPVYTGVKQLVHAFGAQDKHSFKKVVLVEFPRVGVYSIGFVTSEIAPEFSPLTSDKFLSVFIPTTPNPTSGFLVLLPETQVTTINLSHQKAMALIISGGIIQPDRLKEQPETLQ